MIRPLSIRRFERLYLLALALGLLSTMLDWPQRVASFASNPALAEMGWLLPTSVVFNITLRLLLWYFTARQPSIAAKWFVVVLAAIAFVILLFGLVALIVGATPSLAASLAGLASGALYVVSAAYLFRPDARLWFGEHAVEEQEFTE
ncbi:MULTISPECIES: hypothetical protein [Sphingomonas]|uniref:Polysaccharide biosynthesis protein GtrA n=1 Tax=Sphingomonas olei TaxID=1886787 RepID=A0ABY2QHM5_9SPHN|nr:MULTISPECIES: hypothetical protein [Sphingomonas]MDF2603135.1 hypothetical protein [Sphingomonas sp.]THG39845.1 hypothetical protein E5988_09250 [Sphingomonas olei]